MSTDPIENILPRQLDEKLNEILSDFSELIDEIVNYSTHVLSWTFQKKRTGDEHLPIILIYRHIFELIDGISILIRESSIEPCKALLRCVFESLLSLEYIFEDSTEKRAKDFIIWYRHNRLRILRIFDPNDELHKEFVQKVTRDKILKNSTVFEIPDIEEKIESYSGIFKNPNYQESEREFQRIKRKNGRAPRWWFNMHGGPNDICKLADKLGRPAEYEVFYRLLSDYSHGIDIFEGKFIIEDTGELAIYQFRTPKNAQFIVLMACTMGLIVIRLFISRYMPENESSMAKWYMNNVRERYLQLIHKDIIRAD